MIAAAAQAGHHITPLQGLAILGAAVVGYVLARVGGRGKRQ